MRLSGLEVISGLAGYKHLSRGIWDESGNKLRTLCRTSVSPNYRVNYRAGLVTCPKCTAIILAIKRGEVNNE